MALFIIILIFAGLYYADKHIKASSKPKPDCPPHKWVLRFENDDKRGYLICKTCNQIPGEE